MEDLYSGLMEKLREGEDKGIDLNDVELKDHKIIENLSYVDDDLEEHKMDIVYPQKLEEKHPFIINTHGGGFCMGSKDNYKEYGMRLAKNKFAVVNINYRLSIKHKFPAQMEDVISAIKFIKLNADKYNLDIDNMFISGVSSGAYMAMMAACILNDETLRKFYKVDFNAKINAIASNCGMFDFVTLMGDDVDFPNKDKTVELLFGMPNYQELDTFRYSSVLNYIKENFPPVYIMDIENQSFETEAYRLEVVLRNKKVKYDIHIFKKEENLIHAFNTMNRFKQSKIVINETLDFFEKQKVEDKELSMSV